MEATIDKIISKQVLTEKVSPISSFFSFVLKNNIQEQDPFFGLLDSNKLFKIRFYDTEQCLLFIIIVLRNKTFSHRMIDELKTTCRKMKVENISVNHPSMLCNILDNTTLKEFGYKSNVEYLGFEFISKINHTSIICSISKNILLKEIYLKALMIEKEIFDYKKKF